MSRARGVGLKKKKKCQRRIINSFYPNIYEMPFYQWVVLYGVTTLVFY